MPNESAINVAINISGKFSRRQLFSSAAAVLCTGVQVLAEAPQAPNSVSRNRLFMRLSDVLQLQTRTKIVLELEGKLLVNEPDTVTKEKQRTAEVKATSTLDYFELIALILQPIAWLQVASMCKQTPSIGWLGTPPRPSYVTSV